MKNLMILGASYTQLPLIEAAKKLGYKTIAVTVKGNYCGIGIADEVAFIDIKDYEAVYELARKYNIDGIASCGMDTGLKTIGYVNDRLGLCGLTEKLSFLSTNKYHMKQVLYNNGVNVSNFVTVSKAEDLADVIKKLSFPLMVKPVDLQGSFGIYIAKTEKELYDGFEATMKETKENYCIIEEYIDGIHICAEAFVYNNGILFVLPFGKITYYFPTPVHIGHFAPINADEDILNQIKIQSELAIRALELNNCAINLDLVISGDKVYIIELTGRAGVNLPELVSVYYGMDYHGMIAAMAAGDDPRCIFSKRNTYHTPIASSIIIAEKSGKIKGIVDHNKNDGSIYDILIYKKIGEEINEFSFKKRERIGKVIVKGNDTEFCLRKVDEVIKNIEVVIE